MKKNTGMKGKTALITGASRGIGKQVALALAETGVDIAVNYLTHEAEAQRVCSEIKDMGPQCMSICADVSKSSEVARMVEEVRHNLGEIQILVNNAGIARPQRIEDISENDWDEIVDTNLKSAFLVTQAVLPDMRRASWGRIINMSSVAAQLGGVVGPHYAASKAGMIGLTHSYAFLLSKEGITVNTIAPALIATEMVTNNPNASPELIPVGRFGTVDEVADMVVSLVRNGYTTGQTININGGWYLA
jgi:3-oxoacyl-[acyl-carrier protein] reductase